MYRASARVPPRAPAVYCREASHAPALVGAYAIRPFAASRDNFNPGQRSMILGCPGSLVYSHALIVQGLAAGFSPRTCQEQQPRPNQYHLLKRRKQPPCLFAQDLFIAHSHPSPRRRTSRPSACQALAHPGASFSCRPASARAMFGIKSESSSTASPRFSAATLPPHTIPSKLMSVLDRT